MTQFNSIAGGTSEADGVIAGILALVLSLEEDPNEEEQYFEVYTNKATFWANSADAPMQSN